MSTETLDRELVAIEPKDAFAVFTAPDFKLIAPILDRVRKEVAAYEPGNVKTEAGRKSIKAMARKVMKSRTYLSAIGDDLAREAKEVPKKIDATRKHIKDALEAIEAAVLQPVTDWEHAEALRVEVHKETLASLSAYLIGPINLSAAEMRARLKQAEAVDPTKGEEFAGEIAIAKTSAIAALTKAIERQDKIDADTAELEKLRAAAAERERQDREADIASEAAERARKAAEAKAADDIAAANKAREDAERRATEAAQAAVREQEAKAAADAKAAAERERDTKHRAAINRTAVAAFVDGGMSEEVAKLAVTLIAKKQIPSITIAY